MPPRIQVLLRIGAVNFPGACTKTFFERILYQCNTHPCRSAPGIAISDFVRQGMVLPFKL